MLSGVPLLFLSDGIVIAVCVFVGKFFISGAFAIAYYIGPEIFPALFVPLSFSISNFISRIFTISAPQVAEIRPRQTPIIFLIVLTLIAGFFAFLIKNPHQKSKSSSSQKS